MKKRSLWVSFLLILLIGLVTGSCFADDNVKYPLSIKDSMGRTVNVRKEPARIISIAPAVTEVLFALNLGPKVVGVTTWCDFPAEAKKKEKIGSFSDPNIEKIVSLNPDLIIGAAGVSVPALKQLDDLGIPTIISDARTIDGIMDTIMDIAKVTNSVSEGKNLVGSMQKRIDKVVSKVKGVKVKPKAYYELWSDPLMTAGPGTFINDLIVLGGGVNIAGDTKTSWPTYSLETLIQKNPDVIIYAHGANTVAQFKARKGWESIKAIKTGRIVLLPDENIVSRPGPRIVDGLEDIAAALHPEIFK